jgi:hypothetical protein
MSHEHYDDNLKDDYKPKRKRKNDDKLRRSLIAGLAAVVAVGVVSLALLTLTAPAIGNVYSNVIHDLVVVGTSYPAQNEGPAPRGEIAVQDSSFTYVQMIGATVTVRNMVYDESTQQITLVSQYGDTWHPYRHVALPRDGRPFLRQSAQGTLEMFDIVTSRIWPVANAPVTGLQDISGDGTTIAVQAGVDEVTLYSADGQPLGASTRLRAPANRLALNHDGTLLAVIYPGEADLFEHRAGTLREVRRVAFDQPITDAVFTQRNELVVVSTPDVVHIVDTAAGLRRYDVPSGYGEPLNVVASDDWMVLVLTRAAVAWRLDDGVLEPEDTAKSPIVLMTSTPNNPFAAGLLSQNRAVIVHGSGSVRIFDLMTGQVIAAFA